MCLETNKTKKEKHNTKNLNECGKRRGENCKETKPERDIQKINVQGWQWHLPQQLFPFLKA